MTYSSHTSNRDRVQKGNPGKVKHTYVSGGRLATFFPNSIPDF